jgi:hypothetical protein
MCWRSSKKGTVVVHLFYALIETPEVRFPWRKSWVQKFLAHFLDEQLPAWGKILTIDNLIKKWNSIVDRYYMCKNCGKIVDRLLHWVMGREFWSLALSCFGCIG